MKKNVVIISALLVSAIILGGVGVWYFLPERLLGNVRSEDVASIYVFDGGTGRRFTVERDEEIEYILSNLKRNEYKKDGAALFIDGYGFSLTFKNSEGDTIDSVIVDGRDRVRDSLFFYRSLGDTPLCYDYITMLEAKYSTDIDGVLTEGKRWFCADVLDISDGFLTVMPDSEAWEIGCAADVGIKVTTSLEGEGTIPQLSYGDRVRIVYDGRVAESYPCQILTVYSIEKIN